MTIGESAARDAGRATLGALARRRHGDDRPERPILDALAGAAHAG